MAEIGEKYEIAENKKIQSKMDKKNLQNSQKCFGIEKKCSENQEK